MSVRARLAATLILIVIVAVPSGAAARSPSTGRSLFERSPEDQVVLSGSVNVPRGHVVGEVVVFHGSVSVSGVARGDVVILDGPVTIGGQVSGSVVALHGDVRLLATAQVAGDVLGGQDVVAAPGAKVAGGVRQQVRFTLRGSLAVLGVLLGSVAISISALLVLLVLLVLAPRGAERAADALRVSTGVCILWGLILAVGLPTVAVVAIVTIVGLPLGLSMLFALGLVLLIGYALAVWWIGRAIVPAPRTRVGAVFTGWGIATAIGLVPFLNGAFWTAGSICGLGGMTVAVWRARSSERSAGGTVRPGRHRTGAVPTEPALTIPESSTVESSPPILAED